MNKRGFTLIELLTVIAILGILVLIAAPKFLGYTEKANVSHIKSDVKTYETSLSAISLDDEDISNDWEIISPDKVKEYKEKGLIFDEHGLIKDTSKISEDLKIIDGKDLKLKSNLKGLFLYDDKEDEVFYVDETIKTNNSGKEDIEEEEELYDSYEFISGVSWGYNVPGLGYGHYRYDGNKKIVEIPKEIDGFTLTSYAGLFENISVEKVISNENTKNIGDLKYMFAGTEGNSIDLSEFDAPNIKYTSYMFYNSKYSEIDISSLDLSKDYKMDYMFYGTNANIILPSTSTPALENTQSMFANATVNSVDLSNFNFEKTAKFDSMFSNSKINSLEFGNINLSRATSMSNMFYSAQIPNIDVSNWDVSTVKDMSSMFARVKTNKIDLSNWDTSNVTKMNTNYIQYILQGSSRSGEGFLENAEVNEVIIGPSFNTSNLTSLSKMFANVNMNNVKGLEYIKDTNATQAIGMFEFAYGTTLDVSHLKFNSIIAQNYNTEKDYYRIKVEDGLGAIFKDSNFDFIYVNNQSIIDRVNNEITLINQYTSNYINDEDRPVMKIK